MNGVWTEAQFVPLGLLALTRTLGLAHMRWVRQPAVTLPVTDPDKSQLTLADRFPATRWSLVSEARGDDEALASRALGELCECYWFPIYSYIRSRGKSVPDAEDLTQTFFQTLLRRESLRTPEEERGKLRAFLLGAVKRFLIDAHRREATQRRGGGVQVVPLDFTYAEALYNDGPVARGGEDLFDREWAKIVVTRVVENMRFEEIKPEHEERFNDFVPYLTGLAENPPYKELAEKHGVSEATLRKAYSRIKDQFRVAFETELADTVANEEELRDEIVYLLAAYVQRES